DDGLTWRHRRLTGMLKRPGIRGIFAASGTGAQVDAGTHAGRLLQPCVVLLAEGGPGNLGTTRIAAAVAYSDDHGDSWSLGEPLGPSPAGVHTNESSVTALADGTVLLHSRATPHRLVAYSTDGGHTFSVPLPEPLLEDPSDNGSVLRLTGSGDRLVASHNAHRHLRRNTSLRHSPDGGATWTPPLVIEPGASAYSTAVELPNGSIGVLYERGAYEEIVFAAVPLAAVRDAAPSPPEDHESVPGHPELHVEVVPRSITTAPPHRWVFRDPHVALGQADAGFGSEGKEVGQAGAQVVGSRRDFRANYGPPRTGVGPGDVFAYSAAVTNTGAGAVVVRPCGSVEDAGPARTIVPGATEVWSHLNNLVDRSRTALNLRWDVAAL
ncbi:sialidase family protein, partial [Arthrobacter sp. KK5.5]|uniref:sialidase family protein n=1 Tax=Arthrobacter sp. KK5.5 TaxID=3373084 RepID=UPI003EE47D42